MSHGDLLDPAPLTPAQVRALCRAACIELRWGLPHVARELAFWRQRASRIPDPMLRIDAEDALRTKRTNTDGAAVFATILDERNLDVLRLLAVYQALWDYLDSSVERHPTEANGRELHLALIDALDPSAAPSDYYRHHPWNDDANYLIALVKFCQARCRALPSYDAVKPVVLAEARLAQVQALNHLTDRRERDAALEQWAAKQFVSASKLYWFELTAAASASLVILPLLALGGRSHLTDVEIRDTRAAYWPWVTVTTTMLDNFADQAEDECRGNHNYFSHYATAAIGITRLEVCIQEAMYRVRELYDGERHAVLVACMVAMYLSKTDRSDTASGLRARRRLSRSGGSLTQLLVPILRIWRIAYRLSEN